MAKQKPAKLRVLDMREFLAERAMEVIRTAILAMNAIYRDGATLTGVTVIVHSVERDGRKSLDVFAESGRDLDRHNTEATWLQDLAKGKEVLVNEATPPTTRA